MKSSREMIGVRVGSLTKVRPPGVLQLKAPQDLLVKRPVRAAYYANGTIAKDTLRMWGCEGDAPDDVPGQLEARKVLHTYNGEVVWGGYLSSHYGHFLTESAATLWPVAPGSQMTGRPTVCIMPSTAPAFAHDWIRAFRLNLVDLPNDEVVRFPSMRVPEPAWRLNAWISPEIRDVHLYARENMAVPVVSRRPLLWLSRSEISPARSAHDEHLLEWLLSHHVACVKPEKLSLAEQVSLIESSDVVAGIVGSAFHTLLLSKEVPDRLYLCPSRVASAYVAQGHVVGGRDKFVRALEPVEHSPTEKRFPGGYRLVIPAILDELASTVLPELRRDRFAAAILRLSRTHMSSSSGERGVALEDAVAVVAHHPASVEGRRRLGEMFAAVGNGPCAHEQFSIAAELSQAGSRIR